MKLRRLFILCFLAISCFLFPPASQAAENTGESNPFLESLMGVLQESIDEWIGNYKGSLGNVKLLERLGNKVILEVTYDNVKRSDNVYVQGEVRYFSEKLEGFSNTLNSVQGSQGKVTLAIGFTPQEDNAWGTTISQTQSDQIRLFLVRKSNPDRPFGEIVYDLPKIWTNSDAPDEEEMVADSDGIELEDEPGNSNTTPTNTPGPSIFVKPGTILKPKTPAIVTQTPAKTVPQTTTQPATPAVKTTIPARKAPITQFQYKVQSYDFYSNAKSAKWKSASGSLPFPGPGNDRRGFVRPIRSGKLNSGNAANTLLQTHPEFKKNGWIDGLFPMMLLGDNIHFKAIVGFYYGANQTDGATFQVHVKENNKYYRVASARVTSKNYARLDADLSRWAGKKVQIALLVRAGNTSTHDWAVWVKPRLTK